MSEKVHFLCSDFYTTIKTFIFAMKDKKSITCRKKFHNNFWGSGLFLLFGPVWAHTYTHVYAGILEGCFLLYQTQNEKPPLGNHERKLLLLFCEFIEKPWPSWPLWSYDETEFISVVKS